MAIGRGRRREHPNQYFVLLLLRKRDGKKIRKNSTEKKKKVRENKVREKSTGKKNTGKKSTGKKVRPGRASSDHVTLSFPVKKAPLGPILRNFRLRMHSTYFRTGPIPIT